MNYQKKHLESRIKILLSDILLTEFIDEDLNEITITDVVLNADNSIAKIYVDFFADEEKKALSFDILQKKASFLRMKLAKELEIKHIPVLQFYLDDLLENITKIDEVIEKIKN